MGNLKMDFGIFFIEEVGVGLTLFHPFKFQAIWWIYLSRNNRFDKLKKVKSTYIENISNFNFFV